MTNRMNLDIVRNPSREQVRETIQRAYANSSLRFLSGRELIITEMECIATREAVLVGENKGWRWETASDDREYRELITPAINDILNFLREEREPYEEEGRTLEGAIPLYSFRRNHNEHAYISAYISITSDPQPELNIHGIRNNKKTCTIVPDCDLMLMAVSGKFPNYVSEFFK